MGSRLSFSADVPSRMASGGSDLFVTDADSEALFGVDWNVTYNFSPALERAFAAVEMVCEPGKGYRDEPLDWGLFKLNGMTAEQQKAALEKAAAALSDEGSDDYWSGSDRVVKAMIRQMIQITEWSMAHPVDGVPGTWHKYCW